MDKKSWPVVYILTCVGLLLTFLASAVYACQVDDFLLTKEGSLAAATPEALNDVLSPDQGDRTKLTGLLQNGTVLKLKEDVKVRVLERSVEWKMMKIQLPDGNSTYWVRDGSLKQINCK